MYNNIIIVGTGKAGYLHYLKYKKSKYIDNSFVYLSIEEIIKKYDVKTNEAIIDIGFDCYELIGISKNLK